ncbi:MAG: glucose 1-dehydrogenase [Syntrophaceae bacterium]|nr:glucose 1-dehydrogenase [Syntrophaceae bacterium]
MNRLAMFDLTGKVAIVTGGYHRIGRGIAEGLAEAGANIVLCARNSQRCLEACEEIEKMGVQTLGLRCDITQAGEISEMVRKTVEGMGRIDILVNNAGVGGSEKAILKMSEEDWDYTVNIDLKGAFLCTRAVVPEMIKQGGGKIINVSSIGSLIAFSNMSAYCASKGGMVQLTKVMALEFLRYNIQVNCLCPGYFYTPMNEKFFASEAGRRVIQRNIPMNRAGRVEELKGTAIYLASAATNFMTGSCLVIDGGQTIW